MSPAKSSHVVEETAGSIPPNRLCRNGFRCSPLEPLAEGDIHKAWEQLSLMQKWAILDTVCEVEVLPTTPTTRGFDPTGVRVQWRAD